jgi:glycine/D-amino acid oxidase-like deaminating enzyme
MRAVVVGAGIVGAAVAFHLTRAGARVTVVERDRPAGGTTSTTFARLSAFDKDPEAYFRLNHAGMREHAELAAMLPSSDWHHRCGALLWESEPGPLAARAVRFSDWGYPLRWSERTDVDLALVPSSVPRVLTIPEEGWVDASALTLLLLAKARRHGAELAIGEDVVDLARAFGGGGWRVALDSGQRLTCDVVVNAAGAAADRIAALAGVRLGLKPSRGLLADLVMPMGSLSRIVHTDQVSVRPAGPRRVMVRSDQIDRRMEGSSEVSLTALSEDLLRRARATVPGLRSATLTGARVGARVIPLGGYPSVGGVADLPGYYQAATHSGVILAPLVGRLLAEEVTRGEVHPLLAPYRPAGSGPAETPKG